MKSMTTEQRNFVLELNRYIRYIGLFNSGATIHLQKYTKDGYMDGEQVTVSQLNDTIDYMIKWSSYNTKQRYRFHRITSMIKNKKAPFNKWMEFKQYEKNTKDMRFK